MATDKRAKSLPYLPPPPVPTPPMERLSQSQARAPECARKASDAKSTLKRSPSKIFLSPTYRHQSLMPNESFASLLSEDSTPGLVDDHADSVSSADDEDHHYHATTAELWDSFWNGRIQTFGEDSLFSPEDDEGSSPPPFLRRHDTVRPQSPCLSPTLYAGTPPESPTSCRTYRLQHSRDSPPRLPLRPVASYSLFPQPLQVPERIAFQTKSPHPPPTIALPSLPSPSPKAKSMRTSASAMHLSNLAAATSPTRASRVPRSPGRQLPVPPPTKEINFTLSQRPATSYHERAPPRLDLPLSPKSKHPPLSKSESTTPLPTPTAPAPPPPWLNRPLPPLPIENFVPVSFFDDSDDEDGEVAPGPGLAARIVGKIHAHRRTASETRRSTRGGEYAAEQLRRARAGTEGEVPALAGGSKKRDVLVRMLRRSRA